MPLLPGCTQSPHLDAFSVGWLINGHWKKRPSSLDYMWQHVPSRNSPAALHLGRKQQIPGPFKEYQSIPNSLLFYRSKKRAVKGKLGTVEAGEMTEGPTSQPRPAARAPARAASPAPARSLCVQTCAAAPVQPVRALLPEIALLLSAARLTPENPTAGRACSGVTIKVHAVGGKKQVPFLGCLRPWDSGSNQHSGLTCPLVLGTRAPSPGGRRGHVAAFPAVGGVRPSPSCLGNRVTWNVRPASPGLGGGRKGWGAGSGGRWGDWVEKPETWEEGNASPIFFRAPVMQAPVVRRREKKPASYLCLSWNKERKGVLPRPTCSCKYKWDAYPKLYWVGTEDDGNHAGMEKITRVIV